MQVFHVSLISLLSKAYNYFSLSCYISVELEFWVIELWRYHQSINLGTNFVIKDRFKKDGVTN